MRTVASSVKNLSYEKVDEGNASTQSDRTREFDYLREVTLLVNG